MIPRRQPGKRSMASAEACRAVLNVIVYRAGPNLTNPDLHLWAWPSLATIGNESSLSRRAVIYAIQSLEALGWVVIVRRDRLTSRYRPKSPADCPNTKCLRRWSPRTNICISCGVEGQWQGDGVWTGEAVLPDWAA